MIISRDAQRLSFAQIVCGKHTHSEGRVGSAVPLLPILCRRETVSVRCSHSSKQPKRQLFKGRTGKLPLAKAQQTAGSDSHGIARLHLVAGTDKASAKTHIRDQIILPQDGWISKPRLFPSGGFARARQRARLRQDTAHRRGHLRGRM